MNTRANEDRRLLTADATELDDEELDVFIGAGKARIRALRDNSDIDALKKIRRKKRQAIADKVDELEVEAEARGIRVKKKRKKKKKAAG